MVAVRELVERLKAQLAARAGLKHLPAALVLVVLAALLGAGISHRSPTFDEAYHTTRGLSYWWAGDARLCAAHPPVGNALAAVPAAIALPKTDFTKIQGWEEAQRIKVSRGWFEGDYEGARQALMWCRAGMAVLTVLFALYFYSFCYSFFGWGVALAGLVMLAFNPMLLAQAGIATTDLPATAASFVMVGEFARYLRTPRLRQLAVFAVAAGAGMMAKYTVFGVFVLLLPFWLGWGVWRREINGKQRAKKWLTLLGHLLLAAVIILFVFNLVYRFDGTGKPIGELLSSLTLRRRAQDSTILQIFQALPPGTPSPFPRTLVSGLVSVWSEVEGGRVSYFWGEVSSTGWRSYFPVLLAIKTPLPVLVLLFVALVLAFLPPRRPSVTLALFLFVSLGLLGLLVRSKMNIGARHALPLIPFMTVFAARAAQALVERRKRAMKEGTKLLLGVPLLGVALMPVVAIVEFPDYLGYFNGLVGRRYGHKISIIGEDAGQDDIELAEVVKRRRMKPLYYAGFPLSDRELAHHGVKSTYYKCRMQLPDRPVYVALHRSTFLKKPECFPFVEWAELRYEINHHIEIYYVDPRKAPREPKAPKESRPKVVPETESED